MTAHLRRSIPLALVAVVAACSAPPGEIERAGSTRAPIIGGTLASAYPEATLVNLMQQGQIVAACSGSVIAPKVVLTAGHCVYGFDGWQVMTPYANHQVASASSGTTYDWKTSSQQVDPTLHDIGLVFLDTPIQLSQCPTLAQTPVADGTSVVNIGRIDNGQFSNSDLWVSPQTPVVDASSYGFHYDYDTQDYIQEGDSGGPDELPGASPHVIVAVNSGAGGGTEMLARVDLLASWISQQIQQHGGPCGNQPPPPPADAGDSNHDAGGPRDDASSGGGDDAGPGATDDGGAAVDASGANNASWPRDGSPPACGCRTAESSGAPAWPAAALFAACACAAGARRRGWRSSCAWLAFAGSGALACGVDGSPWIGSGGNSDSGAGQAGNGSEDASGGVADAAHDRSNDGDPGDSGTSCYPPCGAGETCIGTTCQPIDSGGGGACQPACAPGLVCDPNYQPPCEPAGDFAGEPASCSGSSTLMQCSVDLINMWRAWAGVPVLARSSSIEGYEAQSAQYNAVPGTPPHAYFNSNGGLGVIVAENQAGPWQTQWFSLRDGMMQGLEAMWAEGPGGDHHDNMANPSFTSVGCGIASDALDAGPPGNENAVTVQGFH